MSNTVIRTNVRAMTSHRNLKGVSNAQAKANNRLSSGKRINNAADDAAGMAIASKMKAQVKGLDQAARNAQDGISLIQTAEGSISEIESMLQRMRELAIQSSNDTNVTGDRSKVQKEIVQLQKEIADMSTRSEFNTQHLIEDKPFNGTFQVGANTGQVIGLELKDLTSDLEAAKTGVIDLTTKANAQTAIGKLDADLEVVQDLLADIGAVQNRLEFTINNLEVSSENLAAAKSRVEDADLGKEMTELTTQNVIQQAATSMLAQSNAAVQNITQILG